MDEKMNRFLDDLLDAAPEDKKVISAIEKNHGCDVYVSIEKHNSLQYTYYFEADFSGRLFFVEIESGINNGTVLKSAEWDCGTKTNTKTVEALTDIVINESYYKGNPSGLNAAKKILKANKARLFEYYRKAQYDSYVTGGNSSGSLLPGLKNLKIEYVFSEIEVDRTFK